ncbi:arsenite S-adenosylmethyltransferase [Calothrix sp. HK-06]|nr:arsenite S-adenosylmethyltransferase [Calothrix sp. HK-06]
MTSHEQDNIRELVRHEYGEAARTVLNRGSSGCCGSGADITAHLNGSSIVTENLYDEAEKSSLPEAAVLASLGCGNPTALAELKPGEVVLDLGSGGGIDVLLSAKRVGNTGFAYGLDMTDEMLALAEQNKKEASIENVRFLKGYIEDIPLPDNSVDVVISNCVINLSADKDKVLSEVFRVLKPGGRFAVSDVVVDGELPDQVRQDMKAFVGCVAGALSAQEYHNKLECAGFINISLEPTRRYTFADLETTSCLCAGVEMSRDQKIELDARIMSAFVRATK